MRYEWFSQWYFESCKNDDSFLFFFSDEKTDVEFDVFDVELDVEIDVKLDAFDVELDV